MPVYELQRAGLRFIRSACPGSKRLNNRRRCAWQRKPRRPTRKPPKKPNNPGPYQIRFCKGATATRGAFFAPPRSASLVAPASSRQARLAVSQTSACSERNRRARALSSSSLTVIPNPACPERILRWAPLAGEGSAFRSSPTFRKDVTKPQRP